MRAGRLKTRVTFERATRVPDGGGGFAVSWACIVRVAGQYRPERGAERLEAGRLQSATAGVLLVRGTSAAVRQVTAADRVLIDGVPHQIRAITNPDQRNRELEMVVERGVAQ